MSDSIKAGVQVVIQRLVDKHGGVRAAQLVTEARSKNSPAHAGFQWDDAKAGETYRLIQARNWIRVVRVLHEDREERLWHVPASTYDEDGDGGSEGIYRTQPVLVTLPDEYERAIFQVTTALHVAARAVDDLRTAAERHESPGRSAIVAQIARGLDIMQSALEMAH